MPQGSGVHGLGAQVGSSAFPEALADAEAAIETAQTLGPGQQAAKQAFLAALEATLALAEHDKARELIATVQSAPAGRRAPFLDAQALRFRARLEGDEMAFAAAERLLEEAALPFWLAVVQSSTASCSSNRTAPTRPRRWSPRHAPRSIGSRRRPGRSARGRPHGKGESPSPSPPELVKSRTLGVPVVDRSGRIGRIGRVTFPPHWRTRRSRLCSPFTS
jgi:hypothetical protein